ncbi:voltage-gated potassium channel [Actinocorallia herbida]|uniref:Voltage-gated potassium channel n=1 Tax=Actinocorallia herbida TaxID=58109 RepID=A0A3N1CR39_9ACTN|nr:potassium channel protein [Actinocorallia herbida]ROO83781.1 voltage-gated potassium channel [Actinocorallia herbida]
MGAVSGILLPTRHRSPLERVLWRVALAVLLFWIVVAVVYLGRAGYKDATGEPVDLVACFYYACVALSSTGYGDIVPVTPVARLVNSLVVTPIRILFLIILVGTTLEVLAEQSREEWRRRRWEAKVRNHVVVIGYGTKGRAAADALLDGGLPPEKVVVVDADHASVAEAAGRGLTGILGDATRSVVQRRAAVDRARDVIVATGRDDSAVLITLTARQINPGAAIQVAVNESENEPLLRQSGADHVIPAAEAAGRLLGLATSEPNVSAVIEDLLMLGSRLGLVERAAAGDEVGREVHELAEPVLAVVRAEETLPYEGLSERVLERGDRLIVVRHRPS